MSEVKIGSDRSFGFVFAGFFAVLAGLNFWHGGNLWGIWLAVAAVFAVVALVAAHVLNPLNRLWLKFGLLLNKIVSPIVLGAVFYLVVTPTGLLLRLFGKDSLHLKLDRGASSYWIARADETPSSFQNQY